MWKQRSTRRLAGVLFLALLISGCATPPQTRSLLDAPPADLPAATELTETPFFPQEQYQCGPAALATVLNHHQVPVTPEALGDRLYIPALKGTLPEELSATARQYGMLAYPLAPSLQDLLAEVADGNPVLIFQNLGTGLLPRWHFAVVVGYDLEADSVILRSGTTRRWYSNLATLERTWARADHWALVVVPPDRAPATAGVQSFLKAAYDLESSQQADAAAAAYTTATRRWPREPEAWLMTGNLHYGQTRYLDAVAAFHQAAAVAPTNPRPWNNLAYGLLQTGCPQQAVLAAECASALAPDDPDYGDTLTEISAKARGVDARHCKPVRCSPPP